MYVYKNKDFSGDLVNSTYSHSIYIALGSNLGDRLNNLHSAEMALPPAVHVLRGSPVYETPPWGYLDQEDFLNQVLQAETYLTPEELLAYLKRIEARLGRKRSVKNGPRLIDLDILFYDDLIREGPKLTIPHPGIGDRAFVLVPLADLAPDLHHPKSGQTIHELLQKVDQRGIRKYST